ncbi:MAG TPA: secretin N-terminal domain-containing protein [Vicinamibacterales bacterium]|nr:secretin N-terminal domain-containing protein [Vicinamibacterales bacterium]
MARAISRSVSLVVVAAVLAGCATTAAMRAGQQAEALQQYDRAVVEYTKVLQKRPDDQDARLSLQRAKLRAAEDHFNRGRRLEASGKLDEALVELQMASELNPGSADIDTLLGKVRTALRNKVAISREGKTELQSLIERSRDLAPAGAELPKDVRLPDSLVFRDASSRDVYAAIGRFADITVAFDPQFRPQPVTIDLRNTTLENALKAVSSATRNFYRVSTQRSITVIPDTPAKRREYEEEIVRTFYLSNADLKETVDLLRIVIDARRIASVAATNAITINDTPDRVAAAARIIAAIDKARPEVVIDVELLEVDRTRLQEYGLQLASPTSSGTDGNPTGIDGTASVNRDSLTLRNLTRLSQSDVYLTNLPSLFYRLLKQDVNTRTLANPQLRTSEGQPATARFGEQVPVPVSVFAPIATGGVQQQPITSYNYKDVGVDIDITPRTHHDDEVTLALKVSVTSISGTGFGGLPTFGNREIDTTIRLHDGETNLLAGLIRDDERSVLSGIPGLSDIPVVGRLFAHNRKETEQTDIVLTLTPHIVRVLDLSEDDLRPFRVGNDDGLGGAAGGIVTSPELPVLPPRDTPAQQPAQPQGAQPAPQPGTVRPIAPPAQTPPAGRQP